MVEEQYVSDETSKMLKEAGFKANCAFIRDDNQERLYCPTQALAARWLREKFGIHIFANYFFEDGTWFYVFVDLKESDEVRAISPDIRSYQSSEEALEAGLKHCLELIKK